MSAIDLSFIADTTYYAVTARLELQECSSEIYNDCQTIASSEKSGRWNGPATFDIDDRVIVPDKYYRLSLTGIGVSWGMGYLALYAADGDAYPGGAYTSDYLPEGKGDIYFILHGVGVSDPVPLCCSNVMFLPGFEASRLYSPEVDESSGEDRLWEPMIGMGGARLPNLYLDSQGKSIRPDIYTKDIIDEAAIPLAGPNIYKSFIGNMDELVAFGTIREWKAIPYDWRLSIDDILDSGKETAGILSYLQSTSSPYIIQELKRLAESSQTRKVTIIAHSNGGLLAKALMLRLRDEGVESLVDKLILVAVPQTGTPQAIGALLHGFDQGLPAMVTAKRMREFGKNMPGAYSLLPSTAYFESVSDPVIEFSSTSTLSWIQDSIMKFGVSIDSATVLSDFLMGTEGRAEPSYADLVSPNLLNPFLISKAKYSHEQIDLWMPASTTQVVQIAGWGRDTVKGIKYFQGRKKGQTVLQYEPLFTEDGDKTVVIPSALVMATSTPNILRYWFNLFDFNKNNFPRIYHANIFEALNIRDFIRNQITNISNLPIFISPFSPPSQSEKKLRFILNSSEFVIDMHDDVGNHTGVSTATGVIEENIPDTQYGKYGSVSYISIPSETVLAINHASPPQYGRTSSLRIIVSAQTNTTSEEPIDEEGSFTLNITEVDGDIIATTTSFIDIPLSTTTIATLDVPTTVASTSPLNVDHNSDGAVDLYIQPGQTYVEPELVSADPILEPDGTDFKENIVSSSLSGGRGRVSIVRQDTSKSEEVLIYLDYFAPEESRVLTSQGSILQKEVKIPEKPEIISLQTASIITAIDGETQSLFKSIIATIKRISMAIFNRIKL